MLYTGDFVLRYYVGFSQIRSQLLKTPMQKFELTWYCTNMTDFVAYIKIINSKLQGQIGSTSRRTNISILQKQTLSKLQLL